MIPLRTASTNRVLSFGPFRLIPSEELLLRAGEPVRVGSRALGVLTVLTERAGEVVGKSELFAAVWPNTVVEESSLRVHIAALRKALGDDRAGPRYIATIPGHGYRFVSPVTLSRKPDPVPDSSPARMAHASFPVTTGRIFGRGDFVASLSALLREHRMVTVVGPGGMGKTSVALTVLGNLASRYADGATFVELALLNDPRLLPTALASALERPVNSKDPLPGLLEFLRNRRALIVLDNCEHLIDAAADLAERIIRAAPLVSVLATSREPLRVAGESIARLPPLRFPAQGAEAVTAAEALDFPAVQLFLERAKATRGDFTLDDTVAPFVADVCRRLDGIPLAIELAAGRIDAFGIRELSSLLDERFRLLTSGRRTALPRQQTLRATLDWSYELLSEGERTVLRRFSVFVGSVSLDSALAVVCGDDRSSSDAADSMGGLVSKSLLYADTSGAVARYRLLETTRSYAREKLAEADERECFARRHAAYYAAILEKASAESLTKPLDEWMADYGHCIDNVHVGIDWAVSAVQHHDVGVALTAAAIPLWTRLTLLEECRTRVEQALTILRPDIARGGRREMQLFAAFAAAFILTRGPGQESEWAWQATLQIAERVGDVDYQLRALWGIWIGQHTDASQGKALEAALRFRSIAEGSPDTADAVVAERMVGTVLWARGELDRARSTIERMLDNYVRPADRAHLTRFQFDQAVAGRSALSLTLWLQGLPEQAMHVAALSAQDAKDLAHDPTIFHATALSGCRLALLAEDRGAALDFLALLQGAVARQASYGVWIRAYNGEMLICDGHAQAGIRLLELAFTELPKSAFHTHYLPFRAALARGFAMEGQSERALAELEDALSLAERSEERWFVAELLRVKGGMLAEREPEAAEEAFHLSLACAREQGARSWELRTAMALARFWSKRRGAARALALLADVRSRFTEGFETADLIESERLLKRLESVAGRGRRHSDKVETGQGSGRELL